jgi:PAS domain S-box-containing protein
VPDPRDPTAEHEPFTAEDWQTLVESAPDLVLRVDRAGVVGFASRAIHEIPAADWVGRPWTDALPGGPQARAAEALAATLGSGVRTAFEATGQVSGATTWWACSVGPVRRRGKVVGAVVIARDFTAQKLTEAQLVLSERLASVGVLAAGVAHEINNPLAAVSANLEMALRDAAEIPEDHRPVELVESLKDALEAAGRGREIVRVLRLFSRSDDLKVGPVDLRKVLDSTLRMAWNEIRHRARLVVEHGRVPAVNANESRLAQVFLNLIVNAAQAIPEGKRDENEIRVTSSVDPQGRAMVAVSDTGPGIPPEVQRRMFTPFFTTKPAGIGTGLGLVICQKILGEMGGSLTFTTAPGRGTEFRVVLPAAEATVAPPPERAAAPPAAGIRGRVLVVDDEAALTGTLTRLLGRQHTVLATNSAREALEKFTAGERFDVVLCDLMMPQVTGAELHAEVARFDPEQAARFVFLTGGAFTPGARAALERLSNPQVDKPFDVAQLVALVNQLVARARAA